MGKKQINEENYKRYLERLAEMQKTGDLTPSPDLPLNELMGHLAAEGEKLLKSEEKTKPVVDESKKLDMALGLSSKNPYIRARVMVLQKMPKWKRNEIHDMERTRNINNPHYEEFVHEVAILGDNLSNQ